jgi:uncharacterized protein (DUF3820 family)
METEKLIEFANTIKHCGDYGGLWIDEPNNHVIWVAGDADFDEEEVKAGLCSSWDYVINGFKSLGIEHVEIEAEWEPDESEGWKFLGRFGIDNWREVEDFYSKRRDY